MALLAIDTCLPACSVAVRLGDGRVHNRTLDLGIGHAEHLAGLVREVLAAAECPPKSISRVATTIGPGSFMGVRVGISFAKGFAFAHGAETVPVGTMTALWLGAPANAQGYVVIDARRGQVFCQGYGPGHATPPQLLGIDAARTKISEEGGLTLIGSGVPVLIPGRQSDGPMVPDIAEMAAHALTAPVGGLHPLYLRAPDAAPAKRPA